MVGQGALHTYEILKKQQLVKSMHHACYWLLSIILAIIIFKSINQYRKDNSDIAFYSILILVAIDISLFIYNGMNFMEMWTGFVNPEYGAIMEIVEFINKQ